MDLLQPTQPAELSGVDLITPTNPKKATNWKKHSATFMERHREELAKPQVCPLCKGHFTYFNKSKHIRTKRHLDFLA